MASIKLGHNCKLFKNGGTYETPSWTAITNVKDVTLNVEATEVDSTTRTNGGWEAIEPGLLKGSVEVQMPLEPTDTDFAAFLAAFTGRTALDLAITDGGNFGAADGQDFRARMKIVGMSEPQPIDDGVIVTWTLKPCYDDNPPTFVKNAGA